MSTIALVAPEWLQDALEVLLEGSSDLELIASSTDVDSLVLLTLPTNPDLVLLDTAIAEEAAIKEVQQIRVHWPHVTCVALVDRSAQMGPVKEAGADLTVLKGSSAQRLKEVLEALSKAEVV